MKRQYFLIAAMLLALGEFTTASAASWLFQPGYYTHQPATFVQVGPPQNRNEANCYSPTDTGYFQGGYRHAVDRFPNTNGTWDYNHHFESWYKVGEQN